MWIVESPYSFGGVKEVLPHGFVRRHCHVKKQVVLWFWRCYPMVLEVLSCEN